MKYTNKLGVDPTKFNDDFIKNIQMFNEYADYLLDLDRENYIALIIMARAMRTIIDPNKKYINLEKTEDRLYWVHQSILEFIIKNKEVDANWFLNRICMFPEPTDKDKKELEETIYTIRKINENK